MLLGDNSVLTGISVEALTLGIKQLTGSTPSTRIENGQTIIYWEGDELTKAQNWLQQQTQTTPYDPNGININIEWLPVVQPMLALPVAGLTLGALGAFLLGRFTA